MKEYMKELIISERTADAPEGIHRERDTVMRIHIIIDIRVFLLNFNIIKDTSCDLL